MSKFDKAIAQLQDKSQSFTWDQAVMVMSKCGFKLLNAKGGGSGRKFYNKEKDLLVSMHEPHPQKELKGYQRDDLVEVLSNAGIIK